MTSQQKPLIHQHMMGCETIWVVTRQTDLQQHMGSISKDKKKNKKKIKENAIQIFYITLKYPHIAVCTGSGSIRSVFPVQ